MHAGTSKADITPQSSVWMDGMLRTHPSIGVHDDLHARALVVSNHPDSNQAFVLRLCRRHPPG